MSILRLHYKLYLEAFLAQEKGKNTEDAYNVMIWLPKTLWKISTFKLTDCVDDFSLHSSSVGFLQNLQIFCTN